MTISKHFNKFHGSKGEEIAVNFLKEKKFKILERNYSNKIGEIDIIAEDKNCLVFVEVKARETLQFGRPAEAVDHRKQQKLRNVAQVYLMTKKKELYDCRFDVVEILGEEVLQHIENAF